MQKRLKTYYIGHILNRPMRRLFMVMLWVIFCVASPAVILYTAGYRYDFVRKQIKQTGVLSVDVLPLDAIVTLNNIQIDKKIPIRLGNRAPGTYSLKIERAGYKTWEKDIVIESNNTTYIKGVTLIKDTLPIRISNDSDVTDITAIQGYNDSIAELKKVSGLFEFHIVNASTLTDTLIYRISSQDNPSLEVSPYTPIAYSRIPGATKDILYVVSLTNPENKSISSIDKNTKLTWNPTNTTEPLYKEENKHISVLNVPQADREIGTVSSSIWYRDHDGKFWIAKQSAIINPDLGTAYTFPDEISSIIDINKNRVIATHNNTTMVAKITNEQVESVQTINGTNTFYNRRTGEWLIWSEWELSSIYPDGGVSLLNRSGDKIQKVTLLDQDGVLLLATEKELAAFNPGYYVRHELVPMRNSMITSVNINKRILYFFGTFAGHKGIYSLEY